jgi:hypothetical protein
MEIINPHYFLSDPQVRPFSYDQRVDLTAPDVPTVGKDRYIVQEIRPPRGQIYVVKAFYPYAVARTDVGLPQESFVYLGTEANGFFKFEPLVNDNSPFIMETNFNAPRTAAGTLLNADRQRNKGVSYITPAPWSDATQGFFNPLFTFLIPSNASYRVIFSILTPALASPIPNPYQIGTGDKRVDFAGCITVGLQMPEQHYHGIVQRVRAEKGIV